jgi:hypothetical protein
LESYRLEKGRYPATLDELAAQGLADPPRDIITGGPMKYHPAPNGHFVLYSVGWNEKDDGGKTVPNPQTRAPDPDQGDWVWPAYPQ